MSDARRLRSADRLATAVVVLLGAAHAAAAVAQGSMNEDGIGYLDVGAAWLRGDWAEAISATWNPLYALLLSPATLDSLPIEARFPVIHGIGFLIFIGAYAAFRMMWRELRRAAERHAAVRPDAVPIPPLPWLLVGHALFAWAALTLIEMWTVTPDMLLAALVFAAAALLLRQLARPAAGTALLYGLVLGFGYLAKPVMFPLGILFLGIAGFAWTARRPARASLGAIGLGLAGFLLLALPWMTAVSLQRGEPTFGESGTLTYVRYVNDVSYPFWTDAGTALGEPVDPIRRVASRPAIWAFGTTGSEATYPPGFDPARWYEGVEPRLVVRRQLEEAAANTAFTYELIVRRLGLPLGALLVLLWLSYGRRGRARVRARPVSSAAMGAAAIAAMGVVGILLYLPVLAEGRYLAPFLVLAFGGAMVLVRVPALRGGVAAAQAGAILVAVGLALEVVAFNLAGAARLAGLDVSPRGGLGFTAVPTEPRPSAGSSMSPGAGSRGDERAVPLVLRHGTDDHLAVARAVAEAGIDPGTRVGVIGWAFDSYWAWLADLRVVAEMPVNHAAYWGADEARRAELDTAFAAAGARLIVAEVRPERLPERWEPLGDTGLAVRRLPPPP